jgi:hypothetical protein
MIAHPSADELLVAVSDFIERIAPTLKDRDVFLARVAVNALATVRREIASGASAEAATTARLSDLLSEDGAFVDLNHRLAEAIRRGVFDQREAELLNHLRASTVEQVKIDQPNYSGLKAALSISD